MNDNNIRVLFAGDLIGKAGRRTLKIFLDDLRKEHNIDLVIVNGENSASGHGITKSVYDEIIKTGADVVTAGNHVWDMKELAGYIDKLDKFVRPSNYPDEVPGKGYVTVEVKGQKITVLNLMGRVFMPLCDCPFQEFDRVYEEIKDSFIFVDFHAEATSEKYCLAHHLDGRAGAVVGTHTHVQTNDEQLLPQGTLFLCDAGMCGAVNSIIGMKPDRPLKKYLTGMPQRYEVQDKGDLFFNGIVFEFDQNRSITEFFKINVRTDAEK